MNNKVEKKSRLLSFGMINASATFLSRILGMVRDIAIASILGASLASDIFFFANRIPNFFRRLFAEGAFAQAFVPVMTEYKKHKSQSELKELLSKTLGTLSFVVLIVCIVGMLLAPVITAIFGYGWFKAYLDNAKDGFKFLEASDLLRITFPYLFFITVTALFSSLLNIYSKFAVSAMTPCLLNITLIIAAYYVSPYFEDKNKVLAYAMSIGGLIQLLFILPFVLKLKILTLPKISLKHEGVQRIYKLMLPGILSVSASQLNLLVNTVLASFLATGSISYLYYSDRLLEFPIGIFAVAISTVILPALSAIDFKTNKQHYQNTLDWGVRLVLLLGIPSMIGIICLAQPILRVLFMRGQFTQEHVLMSSASLLASVSGLCAIMLVRVLVQGFAAIQDTKTPVKCAISAIFANIIFNLILIYPLNYIGLALSTALAAFVNCFLLLYLLHKRQIYKFTKKSLLFILRVLIAALIMGVALTYFNFTLDIWTSFSTLTAIMYLTAFIIGGALCFSICLFVLGFRLNMITKTNL